MDEHECDKIAVPEELNFRKVFSTFRMPKIKSAAFYRPQEIMALVSAMVQEIPGPSGLTELPEDL